MENTPIDPDQRTRLEKAISRLQHVYKQTDRLRTTTIKTHHQLLDGTAPEAFANYRHHFNNTVAFFHNLIPKLSVNMALQDTEVRDILLDAHDEISRRVIVDINMDPAPDTGLRGYAATAKPLADAVRNARGDLKNGSLAEAYEVIGQLDGIDANAKELMIALNDVVALLRPQPVIAAASTELHSNRAAGAVIS